MRTIKCDVCPHGCTLAPGAVGRCRARKHIEDQGKIVPVNYGIVTSLALDPVEKKPLNRFFPGSRILSVGSFGCNLVCPFCQNYRISSAGAKDYVKTSDNYLSPDELAQIAANTVHKGNIGVAFTYNEPLIGYEYVLDTAIQLRALGLKTVLVTNGCVNAGIAGKILPFTDALNIDLKSFDADIYRDKLGGDLETVKSFIMTASAQCHVELTTLIVPGMNDSKSEMQKISEWIASLPNGEDIPLHITRFFPGYKMKDAAPTDVENIFELTGLAQKYLKYVYPGNI